MRRSAIRSSATITDAQLPPAGALQPLAGPARARVERAVALVVAPGDPPLAHGGAQRLRHGLLTAGRALRLGRGGRLRWPRGGVRRHGREQGQHRRHAREQPAFVRAHQSLQRSDGREVACRKHTFTTLRASMPRTSSDAPSPRSCLCSPSRLVAGCGGGEERGGRRGPARPGVQAVVKSADVKIDAELKIDGPPGLRPPRAARGRGPLHRERRASSRRWTSTSRSAPRGPARPSSSGFLSTGDRAFVKFGGEFYEQPRRTWPAPTAQLAKGSGGKDRGSLSELGLNPRTWVVDAEGEGDEEVAGVETEHVSGKLDVRRLFADLNKLVERSAGAVGGADRGHAQSPVARPTSMSWPRWWRTRPSTSTWARRTTSSAACRATSR